MCGGRETAGSENDPCDHHEEESNAALNGYSEERTCGHFQDVVNLILNILRKFTHDLVDCVHQSPKKKADGAAVPEAADEEGSGEIKVFAAFAGTAAAERNINIIAKP